MSQSLERWMRGWLAAVMDFCSLQSTGDAIPTSPLGFWQTHCAPSARHFGTVSRKSALLSGFRGMLPCHVVAGVFKQTSKQASKQTKTKSKTVRKCNGRSPFFHSRDDWCAQMA